MRIRLVHKGVVVFLAFVMGPNIVRIRKEFVPIISREKNISKSLEKIKNYIPDILNEIKVEEGKDKKVFVIE